MTKEPCCPAPAPAALANLDWLWRTSSRLSLLLLPNWGPEPMAHELWLRAATTRTGQEKLDSATNSPHLVMRRCKLLQVKDVSTNMAEWQCGWWSHCGSRFVRQGSCILPIRFVAAKVLVLVREVPVAVPALTAFANPPARCKKWKNLGASSKRYTIQNIESEIMQDSHLEYQTRINQ